MYERKMRKKGTGQKKREDKGEGKGKKGSMGKRAEEKNVM